MIEMFEVKDDLTIYCTRGDVALLSVTADENGVNYIFQPGDVVRMKVFEKKDCQCVVMQKDVIIEETTDKVDILLTGQETRICEVISKPKDFWYEVELNPGPNQQTIIGYDEDGPKVFKMFPEGKEIEYEPGEQASFLEELVEKEVNEALTFDNENTGKLLYVGADGIASVLAVGVGLKIVNGVLMIDGTVQTNTSILGRAKLGAMVLNKGGM